MRKIPTLQNNMPRGLPPGLLIKAWDDEAWNDYLYWQTQDKKTIKKINALLKDIDRFPFDGIGKPEPLKYEFSGYWSRRIDDFNRLVYRIKDNQIEIIQCGAHYRDMPTKS